jgi:hypothetical protein
MTYPYRTGRRAVMNREQAEAIVEAHPDFIVDAWDAVASERPEQLTGAVVEWYRSTDLYERHVEDLMDGTTTP